MQSGSQSLYAASDGAVEVGRSFTDKDFAGRIELRIDLTQFSGVGLGCILLCQVYRDFSDQFGIPVEPESHASLQIRAKCFHQIHPAATNVNFHVLSPPVHFYSSSFERRGSEKK